MEIKKMKVIRVNESEFELEDGRIYDHPEELSIVPTIEEFQNIYNKWFDCILKMIRGDDE